MTTPIVDLSAALKASGTLLVKVETANPTGSVKDRPVEYLLRDPAAAQAETLVEASGGNTGLSLAVRGRELGKKVIVTMSEKMSPGKVRQMEEAGAEVILCPPAAVDSEEHFITVARRIGERQGHWYVDQFNRDANVTAHRETTGPEIIEQVGDALDAFVAGAGTGGTLTGVGQALKAWRPEVDIVLADPAGSILAGHLEGRPVESAPYLVEGIGGDFLPPLLDFDVLDVAYEVDDVEAAQHLETLSAAGYRVGPSSGVTIGAALAYLRERPGRTACALLADDADRYLETWYDAAWLTERIQPETAPAQP